MEIRIPKEKFESIRHLMETCEQHDGTAIVISNEKPLKTFERHYPKKN